MKVKTAKCFTLLLCVFMFFIKQVPTKLSIPPSGTQPWEKLRDPRRC